jgi:hypothetical protein
MTNTALRSKMTQADDAFDPPQEELLSLRWSIAVWLVLAAASWAGAYFALSLIL